MYRRKRSDGRSSFCVNNVSWRSELAAVEIVSVLATTDENATVEEGLSCARYIMMSIYIRRLKDKR